jgi:Putative zinc-finger
MAEMDCTRAGETDLVALYLAGKLPESEAEGFEAHYFGCETCASALREAGEIRAALGQPVLVPAALAERAPDSGRDTWTILAAAATVAMLFFGVRHLVERQEMVQDSGVLRSASSDSVQLTITAGPTGQVILAWPPHPEAHSYRIKIVRSDGVPVLESETADSRVVLAIGDLPPRPTGVQLLARIEALDALRQVAARSRPEPLPGP